MLQWLLDLLNSKYAVVARGGHGLSVVLCKDSALIHHLVRDAYWNMSCFIYWSSQWCLLLCTPVVIFQKGFSLDCSSCMVALCALEHILLFLLFECWTFFPSYNKVVGQVFVMYYLLYNCLKVFMKLNISLILKFHNWTSVWSLSHPLLM